MNCQCKLFFKNAFEALTMHRKDVIMNSQSKTNELTTKKREVNENDI